MTDAHEAAQDIDEDIPVGDTLTVEITLPNVRFLDEEGLARWFPHLDGKWTQQTKALLARFGTDRLDLNWNWFETSTCWTCPCCGRSKPKIARPNEGGVLLAHLHLHHDHMREHFSALLRKQLGTPWAKELSASSRHAEDHMRALVMRFRASLVCDGCNTAEGDAKKALGLPRHFSFTPSEIARFVRPRPNAMNEIDVEEARQVWLGVREEFESRIAFAEVLVERFASGLFAMERGITSTPLFNPSTLDEFIAREAKSRQPAGVLKAWAYRLWGDLSQRSVSRDGVGKSQKRRRPTRVRPPTDAEVEVFERKPGKGWERTPADWTCPCCDRGKRAILRRSGSGRWFTQIRTLAVIDLETDADNLAFRHELYPDHLEGPVVAGMRERYVCADCRDVVSELRRARPDLDGTMLTLEDVRDCLGEIRDNEKAEIDLVLAAERAEANYDLERAEWEFTVHRDLALHRWKVWKGFGPDATAEAREALTTDARAEGIDPEAVPGGMRWLMLQGKAFASEGWGGPT